MNRHTGQMKCQCITFVKARNFIPVLTQKSETAVEASVFGDLVGSRVARESALRMEYRLSVSPVW